MHSYMYIVNFKGVARGVHQMDLVHVACTRWICTVIYNPMCLLHLQGDIGPFTAGLPIEVPLWIAVNLKQRQKARIRAPEWMNIGTYVPDEWEVNYRVCVNYSIQISSKVVLH